MEDVELYSAIALNRILGFTPKYSHALLQELGSCHAVFELTPSQQKDLLGPYRSREFIFPPSALEEARAELSVLRSHGIDFIPIGSSCYPTMLRECQDAPMGLYIRSSTPASELFNRGRSISVIGTRDMTFYGKDICENIVKSISRAQEKPAIVSGLAIGVDITAHMAALACALPTIAVLPCGIDSIYPLRHSTAADKISKAPFSALVTDFPPGTAPQSFTFLRRNRIISGLSDTTILVESGRKGGGMMTARLSSGYGRDVYAVPGRIGDPHSEGCNVLLRERSAEPIVSVDTLPGQLGLSLSGKSSATVRNIRERIMAYYAAHGAGNAEALASLGELVAGAQGSDISTLCRIADMAYSDVASLVTTLQNDGIVETDLLQRCFIHTDFD